MVKEQVIGSYIIRFAKSIQRHETSITITLQDIKTGERLKFETWLAAWAFLEEVLEDESECATSVFQKDSQSTTVQENHLTELSKANEVDVTVVDTGPRKPNAIGAFTKMAV